MSSGGGETWKRRQDGNKIDEERSSGKGVKWAKSKSRPGSPQLLCLDGNKIDKERSMGEAAKNDGDEDNDFMYIDLFDCATTAKMSDGAEANDADNGRDM